MARINTNISSMIAQANLARSNADLALRLQRLATGLRINRGAHDHRHALQDADGA